VRVHYGEGGWGGSVGMQWIKMLQCQCAVDHNTKNRSETRLSCCVRFIKAFVMATHV
jgi:hypothetical protein